MIRGDVSSCRPLRKVNEKRERPSIAQHSIKPLFALRRRSGGVYSLANRWTVGMEAVEGVRRFCPGQQRHNGPFGGIINVPRAQ